MALFGVGQPHFFEINFDSLLRRRAIAFAEYTAHYAHSTDSPDVGCIATAYTDSVRGWYRTDMKCATIAGTALSYCTPGNNTQYSIIAFSPERCNPTQWDSTQRCVGVATLPFWFLPQAEFVGRRPFEGLDCDLFQFNDSVSYDLLGVLQHYDYFYYSRDQYGLYYELCLPMVIVWRSVLMNSFQKFRFAPVWIGPPALDHFSLPSACM